MSTRVMILSASVGSGHTIAAGVLESSFRHAPGVEAVQALDTLELTGDLYRSLYDDAYFALVDAAPWLVGWAYAHNEVPFRDGNVVSLWDQLNTTGVVKAIRAYQPHVEVCTHFLPAKLI